MKALSKLPKLTLEAKSQILVILHYYGARNICTTIFYYRAINLVHNILLSVTVSPFNTSLYIACCVYHNNHWGKKGIKSPQQSSQLAPFSTNTSSYLRERSITGVTKNAAPNVLDNIRGFYAREDMLPREVFGSIYIYKYI